MGSALRNLRRRQARDEELPSWYHDAVEAIEAAVDRWQRGSLTEIGIFALRSAVGEVEVQRLGAEQPALRHVHLAELLPMHLRAQQREKVDAGGETVS